MSNTLAHPAGGERSTDKCVLRIKVQLLTNGYQWKHTMGGRSELKNDSTKRKCSADIISKLNIRHSSRILLRISERIKGN